MIRTRQIVKFLFVAQLVGGFVAALQYAVISSQPHYSKPLLGVNLLSLCTSVVDCKRNANCLICRFPSCKYNDDLMVNCTTNSVCDQPVSFLKEAKCRFCWQTEPHEHECDIVRNCSTIDVQPVRTTCRVKPDVVCLGRRAFYKNVKCDWTNGYSWSTAMFLSITLGGFGIDRFYLGLWKSAIGKMFSFGGLGVWTIIDIVLIGFGYLVPVDNSRYI